MLGGWESSLKSEDGVRDGEDAMGWLEGKPVARVGCVHRVGKLGAGEITKRTQFCSSRRRKLIFGKPKTNPNFEPNVPQSEPPRRKVVVYHMAAEEPLTSILSPKGRGDRLSASQRGFVCPSAVSVLIGRRCSRKRTYGSRTRT